MQLRFELIAKDDEETNEIKRMDDASSEDGIGEEQQNVGSDTRVRYWMPVCNIRNGVIRNLMRREYLQ